MVPKPVADDFRHAIKRAGLPKLVWGNPRQLDSGDWELVSLSPRQESATTSTEVKLSIAHGYHLVTVTVTTRRFRASKRRWRIESRKTIRVFRESVLKSLADAHDVTAEEMSALMPYSMLSYAELLPTLVEHWVGLVKYRRRLAIVEGVVDIDDVDVSMMGANLCTGLCGTR